jgi:glycerophosphoryl diester phosphodiesterase
LTTLPLDHLYSRKPLIFGHRGASAYAPMNTIPAFELAAEMGADGIELDVHRLADGQVVVVHDFTVDKTTDGTGKVTEMTLEQLRALDAGAWFDPKYAGTRVPTLDEVFEAVGQRLIINVEIKAASLRTDGIETRVAESIRRHRLEQRVIVSSFNPMTLRRFRKVAPEIAIGYLFAPGVTFFGSPLMTGLPHEAKHPHHEIITEAFMARARRSGHRVNTWTINDPDRARHLRNLGVDAIITDKPDIIRQALEG